MENLFLQAIGNDKVEAINKIKKNKEFLKKLIGDLQQVYTLYVSNEDNADGSMYKIKNFSNHIPTVFFNANENGCTFSTKMVGYRVCASRPEWALGWIAEKYDTCIGDSNFMREDKQPHGHINVNIKFTDVSANLMDIVRDIARILDHEKVAKRF
jgi:hypothetical protein